MADNITIAMRLRGHRQVSGGLKSTAGDVDKFGRSQDRAARSGDKMDRSTRRSRRGLDFLKRSAAGAGLVFGGALVIGAKKSITAYEESRKELAQTHAVLRSTKGIANVSAKGVDALTGSLMRKTAIDDEQIRQGANMLLTFTNIRNEAGKSNKIFDQSVTAATDMGVALKSGPRAAALLLGKALNDPAKGMGRLQRAGVTFSTSQKKQIETLQASGNLLGAQGIILREVNKEFGGSAKAQATPLQHLKTTIGELSEDVGGMLAPQVDKGAAALTTFLGQMRSGKGSGGQFVAVMSSLWQGLKPVAATVGDVVTGLAKFGAAHPGLVKVAGGIVAVGLAVKTISFASRITGLSKLLSGLGRLANTNAGQKAKEKILQGFNGLAPGVNRKTAPARTALQNTMATSGTTAGNRAGGNIITTTGGRVERSARAGRLRSSFTAAGRLLGPAMGAAVAVGVAGEISKEIKRQTGVDFDNPSGDPSRKGKPSSPGGTPTLLENLTDLFGAKGGLLTRRGFTGYKRGGMIPQGEDTLIGARFGEYMMSKPAVDRFGADTFRQLNRGFVPTNITRGVGDNQAGGAGLAAAAAELRAAVDNLTQRGVTARMDRGQARRQVERDRAHEDAGL